MKRRPFNNNRGVALIVVILMISIIIAVTLELNRTSRASVYESANLADHVKLTYLAKSGFNAGVAILLDDKNGFDGLNEDWALLEVLAAKSAGLMEVDALQIRITDESGKIPINRLVTGNAFNEPVKDLLVRFLMLPEFGLGEQKAREIVDAVKDWIDADEDTTGDGAESGYYQSQRKPYAAKNKPLDCIDEILMIKGVTRELYEGTTEAPGIGRYLTVYGDGKINVNTAPMPVLKALFKYPDAVSADALEQMDIHRTTQKEDLSGVAWFKEKIPGMAGVDVNTALIKTGSDDFEISATVRLNNVVSRVSGAVNRQDRKKIKLLSWELE